MDVSLAKAERGCWSVQGKERLICCHCWHCWKRTHEFGNRCGKEEPGADLPCQSTWEEWEIANQARLCEKQPIFVTCLASLG